MDIKLQRKLFRKYPYIFENRKRPSSETRMCDGITCGNGWYQLIDDLCRKLKAIMNVTDCYIVASQVKEKFAGLRFYIDQVKFSHDSNCSSWKDQNNIREIISDIIYHAHCDSFKVCEECGKYRDKSPQIGNYVYAMCDKCFKKFSNKRKFVCPEIQFSRDVESDW